jgi:recombination protein RecT
MANSNIVKLQGYFNNENVMKNLRAMLGQKAQGFATSVLSVVNNNRLLQNSDPASIYSSAMVAASLDLPINPNLGFAAIVPYGKVSQFQIMTRGLIQLAIRSGQYEKITNAPVHKGELIKCDPFRDEYEFDASKRESDEVIGYMAYFRTVGGFEKYFYMTKDEALAHGRRYSKSFNSGPWKDNQEAMCLKTVLKLLLSKYGILSIEMQRAIKFDQGVVREDLTMMESIEDIDAVEVDYADNPNGMPTESVQEDVDPSKGLFDNDDNVRKEDKNGTKK